MRALVGLSAGACSSGKDAETSTSAVTPTLWAGGGFACLERAGSFDCRLLDYFTSDNGQAAVPNDKLKGVSFFVYDTCVVETDGTGACFGANTNHSDDLPDGTWTMISQGGGQACGLHPDGTVACWGSGSAGYTPPSGPFVDVQAIDGAACAQDAGGQIRCWGNDYLGHVVSPEGTWTSFILPSTYLCMLDAKGSISCSGITEVADADIPTGTGYHSLTGGFFFACALNAEDHAVCWGKSADGMLDAPDDKFVQIASGSYFTCGLKADGDVKCWGCREESASDPTRYCDWDNPAPWWVP